MPDDRLQQATARFAELNQTVRDAIADGRFSDAFDAFRDGQSIVSGAPLDARQQFRDQLAAAEADAVTAVGDRVAAAVVAGSAHDAKELLAAAHAANNSVRSVSLRGDLRDRLRELDEQVEAMPVDAKPASPSPSVTPPVSGPATAPVPKPEPVRPEPVRPSVSRPEPERELEPAPAPEPASEKTKKVESESEPADEPTQRREPRHEPRREQPARRALSTKPAGTDRRRRFTPVHRSPDRQDRPAVAEIRRTNPLNYPFPPASYTGTLKHWVFLHGAPPTRQVAIRLLARFGFRLPTVAELRGTRVPSMAPVFVRDHDRGLWLPGAQRIGFPRATELRRQLIPV